MFCFHKWEVESTNYTKPKAEFNVSSGNRWLMQMLIEGTTHIYMRCAKCKSLKEKRVFGKYEPPNPYASMVEAEEGARSKS